MKLTNHGDDDITIDRIWLLWPTLNGKLKKIKLDKKTIHDQRLAPPEATVEDGWKGGDKDREIEEGKTKELKLELEQSPQPGGTVSDASKSLIEPSVLGAEALPR